MIANVRSGESRSLVLRAEAGTTKNKRLDYLPGRPPRQACPQADTTDSGDFLLDEAAAWVRSISDRPGGR